MKTLNNIWAMVPEWLQGILTVLFLPVLLLGGVYLLPVALILIFGYQIFSSKRLFLAWVGVILGYAFWKLVIVGIMELVEFIL